MILFLPRLASEKHDSMVRSQISSTLNNTGDILWFGLRNSSVCVWVQDVMDVVITCRKALLSTKLFGITIGCLVSLGPCFFDIFGYSRLPLFNFVPLFDFVAPVFLRGVYSTPLWIVPEETLLAWDMLAFDYSIPIRTLCRQHAYLFIQLFIASLNFCYVLDTLSPIWFLEETLL